MLVNNGIDVNEITNDSFMTIFDNLPYELKNRLLKLNVDGQYDFDKNFQKAQDAFKESKKAFRPLTDKYDLSYFYKIGLCRNLLDKRGFFKPTVNWNVAYRDFNVYTLTKRDMDGFDYHGIDERMFYRDGIHSKTREKYDEHFFNQQGFWCEFDGTDYVATDRKVDNHGFNQDGFYCDLQPDGTYIVTDQKVHNNFDIEGHYYKLNSKGRLIRTDSKRDDDGYDIDGLDDRKFNRDGINDLTNTILDVYGFNKAGFFCIQKEDGTIIETKSLYNKYYFDCYGFYYGLDENGNRVKTDRKTNPIGFNIDLICESTGKKYDSTFFDIDGFVYEENEKGEYVLTDKRINEKGFDCESNFYELQEDGTYLPTGKKINNEGYDYEGFFVQEDGTRTKYAPDGYDCNGLNQYGFDRDGIHCVTKEKYDSRGFMADGLFHLLPNGKQVKRPTIYDNHYFDIKGFYYDKNLTGNRVKTKRKTDYRHFDCKGFNHRTNGILDERNFDFDGYFYYKKKSTGEYVKTKSRVDRGRFDCNGTTYNLDGKPIGSELNIYGFNVNRKWKYTELYDPYGFDYDGVNVHTGKIIDKNNFDRDGFFYVFDEETERFVKAQPERKVNDYNFDRDGYIWENGRKTNNKRTADGYNIDGWDVHMFNRDGINMNTGTMVNSRGFNQQGYYCIKQEDGTFIVTDRIYDDEGYNIDGYDENGFTREHNYLTGKKVDDYGFKYDGINIKTGTEWDIHKFNIKKIHQSTHCEVDEYGFNIDGYYCIKQEDGSFLVTEDKVDPDGFNIDGRDSRNFDRNGFYNGEPGRIYDERGYKADCTYKDTGLMYNERYYDYRGLNIFTEHSLDVRGFDENGIYRKAKSPQQYDLNGFDVDGINEETQTKFDKNGYNCYGVDKTGRKKDGKLHESIKIFIEYTEFILKGGNERDWINAKKINELKLKKDLFMACEMFPELKEELMQKCEELLRQIDENEKSTNLQDKIKNMALKQRKKRLDKILEF